MQRFRGSALLLCVALAAAGCSAAATVTPAPPRPGIAPPPAVASARTLSSADIPAVAALLRMEDRRLLDAALARTHYGSTNPEVRRRAVLAAARTGDREAAAFLRAALSDPSVDVRAAAVFGLGELGDTASVNVAALRATLQRGAGDDAAEAAHALGKLIHPLAYDALASALTAAAGRDRAAQYSAPVVEELLLAIWHHPRQPRTAAFALPFMTSPNAKVRFAATYALMRARNPAAVPALLLAIRDADPLVRQTAARALQPVVVDSAGMRDSARAALLVAMKDSSAQVRINAVRALGVYAEPANADAIGALLTDRDGNVRTAATAALGDAGGSRAADLLMAATANPAESLSIRASALAALVRLDAGRGLPVANAWADSAEWLQRVYGVRALAVAPYTRVSGDLRRHIRDSDARVEAEALAAFAAGDTTDTTHALDALYIESLASADVMVRVAAINALARHNDRA